MTYRIRITLCVAFAIIGIPFANGSGKGNADHRETFTGKVVPLEKILEKQGVKLDKDASPYFLILVTTGGKSYPLIKDDGSRRFFKDATLLNREVRITGKIIGNPGMLQVLSVSGIKDGKLTEIYYWCDICAIKRFEKMICECCNGPMDFREEEIVK